MTDFGSGAFIILCGCFVLYMLLNERRAKKTRDSLTAGNATCREVLASCERTQGLVNRLNQTSAVEWKRLDERIKTTSDRIETLESNKDCDRKHLENNVAGALIGINRRVDETSKKLDEHIDNNKNVGNLRAVENEVARLVQRVASLEARNKLQDAALNAWRAPETQEYNG